MELRQLQYFLAVAESGSLSKASAVVGVAQPALSRAIRQLELDVGAQLFYRHGRGIRLTEEGARFQESVTLPLRQLLAAKDDLCASGGQVTGMISLGMPPSMSAVLGAPLVELFLRNYPRAQLTIMDGLSGYVNEWLVSGRVDMAIINNARGSASVVMDRLVSVALFHVTQRSSAPPEAATAGVVRFQDVLGGPLLLPGRHHGLRRQVETAAREQGVEPNIIVEVDALEALTELVRRGVGSTIVPYSAISRQSDPDILVRRIVEPELTMQFMIAYSAQRPTSLAMRELAKLLKLEIAAALAEGRLIGQAP